MSGAILTFEPAGHEYRLPNGQRVPSVTQILRATGVSVDFDALRAMGGARRDAIDLKRDIGRAVHHDAHAFDDDDLDWSTVHPDVAPYLRAWVTFRENSRLAPMTRERLVYHPGLAYGGTLDGIFASPTGRRVLVDIKTGDPEDSGCRYQTAGYQLAFEVEHGAAIDERWGVQLMPDRGVPYLVWPYTDWQDADRWRAIVTTYYAQPARRRSA